MKAKEAFKIAKRKISLTQIAYIEERIRTEANRGKFLAQIATPAMETKQHFEEIGYYFFDHPEQKHPDVFISWDLTKNTNETTN